METETKYVYLVLSKDFGLCAYTTVHATEAGAQAAIADLGDGGLYVSRQHWYSDWHGDVSIGMEVRLGGVSTPYDDDYTSPTVRDASHDASWGKLVNVLP